MPSFVPTDVTDDGDLDRLIRAAVDGYGRLDILVFAIAVFDDELPRIIARAVAPGARREPRLGGVLTARRPSVTCRRAAPSSTSHRSAAPSRSRTASSTTSSKAGLLMLAKTAAQQLAPRGIRVNAVSPGWMWSRNIERRYGTRERADALGAEFHAAGPDRRPGGGRARPSASSSRTARRS